MPRLLVSVLLSLFLATSAMAGEIAMSVTATKYGFKTLVKRLDMAIAKHKMFAVTRASASIGATGRGIKIRGNMVIGVYRNDFAVRMLAASIPAGIEAPIRYYIIENADGTASLAYRKPSVVFAPYKGGAKLTTLAAELDRIFAAIARDAVK
ncbi:MAG: DUF302 domain-containing protein [Alphaproteobacteria bacterium]|nr:DUF302 domain-containing protein [Alphaproteobacteria bacterium]